MPRDPERPRLVAVEARPVHGDGGEARVEFRDPSGIVRSIAVLSLGGWWVAARLDGQRTCAEIAAEARAQGSDLSPADVARLAAELSAAGLVEGEVHDRLLRGALDAYRSGPARAPSCAGGVYPGDPAALRALLDRHLANGAGPAHDGPVRLLVAPHIDYARGAAGYAMAYRALAATDAELYVVFGTAHTTPVRLFTLTRKDYATPLGAVETDRRAVDGLAAALGEDEVLGDELAHRDEHSVELQMVWLRHVVRRPFTAIPVLCSSISHLRDPDPPTARFLGALARAIAGRRTCFVASADLAHVGPAYGDPRPPTPAELAALADRDRRTLAFVSSGDATGFHRDATDDDARRRLCGVAPIYAAMRASGASARLLHYGQWTDGTDSVSFAAAAGS